MTIPIAHVRERAQQRPTGYFDDVIAAGLVVGDELHLSAEAYARLAAKYNPPSLVDLAASAVTAAANWAAAGFPVVDDATLQTRSSHCAICPRWDARAGRCLECGCYGLKHWLATERCPLGHW